MTPSDVTKLYFALQSHSIQVWIDGGWCIDALVGRQTRDHADLDLAVGRADADRLVAFLASERFVPVPRDGTTPWNFVLGDDAGRRIDVHVVEYDPSGAVVYGIAYPHGSLTGTGTIDGRTVACIDPKWMFTFKTAYPPAAKDLHDVRALADRFGFEVPPSHR